VVGKSALEIRVSNIGASPDLTSAALLCTKKKKKKKKKLVRSFIHPTTPAPNYLTSVITLSSASVFCKLPWVVAAGDACSEVAAVGFGAGAFISGHLPFFSLNDRTKNHTDTKIQ
jgi:hypothetical protein